MPHAKRYLPKSDDGTSGPGYKKLFNKSVLAGVLSMSLLTGAGSVFADTSYYNFSAVRKPNERRVADAKKVAEKCWRPSLGEGRGLMPETAAVFEEGAGLSSLSWAIFEKIKERDIAFCPAETEKDGRVIRRYSEDSRIIELRDGDASENILHDISFKALYRDLNDAQLLQTASTEKRVRRAVYEGVLGDTLEILLAIEEKKNGSDRIWRNLEDNFPEALASGQDAYQKTFSAGGGHEKSMALAGQAVFENLLYDPANQPYIDTMIVGELSAVVFDFNRGRLWNRPIDSDNEKLDGLLKKAAGLFGLSGFSDRLEAPSFETLFREGTERLWQVQEIDHRRAVVSYGEKSTMAKRALSDMRKSHNPYLEKKTSGPFLENRAAKKTAPPGAR